MKKTAIIAGARTPFGVFGGSLKTVKPAELGGHVLQAAAARANTAPEEIEEVLMGHVLQGGQGQITSRQAAHAAGFPWDVTTETINKVCASGMRSVTFADQIIRAGDGQIVAAGGMESMSQAPYTLPNMRFGERMGDGIAEDLMLKDGLQCSFTDVHMGVYGNYTAEELEISRSEQDAWAARSHELAAKAQASGRFAEEIEPIEVRSRKGDVTTISEDEALRPDTTVETLAGLKPVFGRDGTITAGNAPGVNDGACAMLLMDEASAHDRGMQPLATIECQTSLALEAKDFPKTPGLVIEQLLRKSGCSLQDIDLFEVNEAFAAVALASRNIAKLDEAKLNVNGGAVALGHPIGASGARIILTLAHELKRRGGGLGIAAICSGGGQGDAVLLRVDP
ncbi:acetyl-CoA C-acetyltransferase [Salsuginibacillus halophilus]|uniref:acetyl-CoA C-acetyltransferase n=1 Tax=Salsuginibacillus halophilus TaxID=517424 RepID=A0A2P8HI31_9BACI|nr:acetyl-CoA C-acetyltransferase [Salsuginibacillus halophilus]PSL45830.1 acetyl-CoA C-acetyltransferase [Salsuginibacillus halophilus]